MVACEQAPLDSTAQDDINNDLVDFSYLTEEVLDEKFQMSLSTGFMSLEDPDNAGTPPSKRPWKDRTGDPVGQKVINSLPFEQCKLKVDNGEKWEKVLKGKHLNHCLK